MTRTGLNRRAYRAIEAPPSRFDGTPAYSEWAARADRWAVERAVY